MTVSHIFTIVIVLQPAIEASCTTFLLVAPQVANRKNNNEYLPMSDTTQLFLVVWILGTYVV